MAGAISLSLEREPEYFRGANIAGADDRTILVFEGDRLACMGRSSVRACWINGQAKRVGYLAELRLDGSARGRFDLIRRGYRYFRELDQEEPAAVYFTSIAADNERARRLLESGSRGLPNYDFLDEFATILIAVPRRSVRTKLILEKGSPARVTQMVTVLNNQAGQHQLGASWTEKSLRSLARHGLPLERFLLVLEGSRVVACGALWDQRAFRQTVIRDYAQPLRAARALINLSASCLGTLRLPAPGSALSHAYASPLAFEAGYESLLPDLIESFFPIASKLGLEYLTIGLPAIDERLPYLRRRFSTRCYGSRLYCVSWPGSATERFTSGVGMFFPDVAFL
ncbi:hypothetical protein BH09VER1_BH09VER1_22540 [soil metagenome]